MKNNKGVSLTILITTIIVIIILAAIAIWASFSEPEKANKAKFFAIVNEVQTAVSLKRIETARPGSGGDPNKLFREVNVSGRIPNGYVSPHPTEVKGYIIDLNEIERNDIEFGKNTSIEDVIFGETDTFIYDETGKVYYAAGYNIEGEIYYTAEDKAGNEYPEGEVYSITYDLKGGVDSGNPSSYSPTGNTITLIDPTKIGYEFIGWTGSNGDNPQRGVTIPRGSVGDKTFEANWTEKTYNIIYNLVGGVASNPGTYTLSTETFVLNNPTKAAGTFIGWTGSNGNTPQLTVSVPTGSTGNKVFIANWHGEDFTITYNLNGGAVLGNPTTYKATTSDITLKNPTKVGYIFTGWTGSNGETPETTVMIPRGSIGNRQYIANWNAIDYTITYNLDGGIATNPTTYNADSEIILNIPIKTGYIFAGWTGSNGTTPQLTVTIPRGSTGNKNYTANWNLATYTITYNLNGGIGTNPTSYNITTSTITLVNPTKAGYEFTGWTGSNGTTPQLTVTIPKGTTGNKNYTANWIDTIPPTNVSVIVNNNDIYTKNANVNLSLSAIGADYMYISNSSTTPTAMQGGWISYAITASHSLDTINGTKIVYVWFKDEANNISIVATDSIILDNVAPTISLNGTTTENGTTVTIPLKITEVTSGINTSNFTTSDIVVKIGETTINPTKSLVHNETSGGVYSYTLTLSGLEGSGNLSLVIEPNSVIDNAGNGNILTTINTGITIDTVPPMITFGTNGSTTWAKEHSTTITVTDASGINSNSLKYQWTQSDVQPSEASFVNIYTNGATITKNTGSGNNWYLWAMAKDTKGIIAIQRSEPFYLDNTPPESFLPETNLVKEPTTITNPLPTSELYSVAQVGDLVEYNPGNISTVAIPSKTGTNGNQKFNMATYSGSWKVLSKSGNSVYLVSTASVGNLSLYGATGRNNAIAELNYIGNMYANTDYAIDGRSIGDGDIVALGTAGARASTTCYLTSLYSYYSSGSYSYNPYQLGVNVVTSSGVKTAVIVVKNDYEGSRDPSPYEYGVTGAAGVQVVIRLKAGLETTGKNAQNKWELVPPQVENPTIDRVTVSGEAIDTESGVSAYYFSIDNGQTWTSNSTLQISSYVFNNLQKDIHRILMKAVDRAGNERISAMTSISNKDVSDLYSRVRIGDEVEYNPPEGIRYVSIVGKNESSNQTYTTTQGLTWKVINKASNTVYLASTVSIGNLSIYGDTGRGNAIAELNNICASYKNTDYATEARSAAGGDVDSINRADATTVTRCYITQLYHYQSTSPNGSTYAPFSSGMSTINTNGTVGALITHDSDYDGNSSTIRQNSISRHTITSGVQVIVRLKANMETTGRNAQGRWELVPQPETLPDQSILANAVQAGDIVNYSVNEGVTYISPLDKNLSSNQTFTSANDKTWKVLSKSGDIVYLVSTQSIGGLSIYGDTGRSNAIGELNNIATIYKNSIYATAARSIGRGDVDNISRANANIAGVCYLTEHYHNQTTSPNGSTYAPFSSGISTLITNGRTSAVITHNSDYDGNNSTAQQNSISRHTVTSGVQVVVTLKPGIKTTGKDENGRWNLVEEADPSLPQNILYNVVNLGDKVEYAPSAGSYTSLSTKNGNSTQTFNTSSYTGDWRVLYKDATSVYLISQTSVGSITFKGSIGRGNSIGELNSASSIYLNSSYADSARSIGGVDVIRVNSAGVNAPVVCFVAETYFNDYKIENLGYQYNPYSAGIVTIIPNGYKSGITTDYNDIEYGTNSLTIYNSYQNEVVATSGIQVVVKLKAGMETTGKNAAGKWELVAQ